MVAKGIRQNRYLADQWSFFLAHLASCFVVGEGVTRAQWNKTPIIILRLVGFKQICRRDWLLLIYGDFQLICRQIGKYIIYVGSIYMHLCTSKNFSRRMLICIHNSKNLHPSHDCWSASIYDTLHMYMCRYILIVSKILLQTTNDNVTQSRANSRRAYLLIYGNLNAFRNFTELRLKHSTDYSVGLRDAATRSARYVKLRMYI